ncbi:MAG TPA: rod shape-determining protein MreC [Candidatus Limnocylindria bacterium]|nr:rod shape-determining protein MreC [Candidatus Limnocylindria bacterium]
MRARAPGGGSLRTFLVLFSVSVLILVLRNTDALRTTSAFGTAVLVPVQRAFSDVGAGIDRFARAVGEIDRLRGDNARLRDDNDRLFLENVRLREQAAAAELAARLGATARALPYESVPADVIGRDPTGVIRTIILGAGTDQKVAVGHVVLSDQGLVGRVSEVGPNYSKVQLVTDPASVVSALVQGSRATGLVRGQFGDTLVMEWILQTEPVKIGDVAVTAGLAFGDELRSLYPKGLVLGRVVEVQRAENTAYLRAVLLPAVDLRKLERVLIVKAD